MDCHSLVPTDKWMACEKVRRLKNCQLKERGDCCVCGLYVSQHELCRWTEKGENIGLQHLMEVFFAILCYTMLQENRSTSSAQQNASDSSSDEDSVSHIYLRHIRFIKEKWYTQLKKESKSILSDHLNAILQIDRYTLAHKQKYKRYLDTYLAKRGLPNVDDQTVDTVYESMDLNFYSTLFDEYFCERDSFNLVRNLGGYGPNPYTKHSFLSVHVSSDLNSCVGFICMSEYLTYTEKLGRRIRVEGIVSCPFYRLRKSEDAKLGAANTLISYLDEYRAGEKITVNPIARNKSWKNRLAEIPFFVDNAGNRIKKEEERLKRSRVSDASSSKS